MHRVVLLGFGLRVLYLDSQSLWFNETSSIYIARRGPLYIAQHLEADHVPLHFLLLYGWAGLAGLSEFAVRFLSVCAGVLTIPLLYQVLRLAGRRQLAVVGAGALALAPFHIYYSQEARMHVLACFFVTLAAYAQISAWQRHANARWALYGASAAAALYTWAYSGLALVGLNLALLLSRRRPRAWWLANVAAVLAIVPWTAIVASRFVSFIGDRVALAGQEPFGWADALRSTTMLAF
ncbi:MAG TPA: glycosyltransferase family 39 protein, partial [Chloroflexota bacterium]|nr:glycosyltransferase family 39 protein [Chloroflexota bacterium]